VFAALQLAGGSLPHKALCGELVVLSLTNFIALLISGVP
jgi:hypothetical protein